MLTWEQSEAASARARAEFYRRRSERWPVYALVACLVVAIIASGALADFLEGGWL